MSNPENSFDHTRAALVTYDAGQFSRDRAWALAETNADVIACDARDKAALILVRVAFYHDTQHINSLQNCMQAPLRFMRQCAEIHAPAAPASVDPESDGLQEFTFDVKLTATFRVRAHGVALARDMLRDCLNCADANFGAWPDGSPILAEASIDGTPDLVED